MANNIIRRTWKRGGLVNIEDLRGSAFQAESGGHTFQISGVDIDGNPLALSGTPAGVLLRADGQDVALTCSVSDGVVSATLPANAYVVPGRVGITIFLTSDGQKTAIYAAVGSVATTSSGTVAPPAGSDVVDLVNAIATAVATIPASYTDLMAAVAPTYSTSALYAVGSYAWYDGKLYRCTTAITSGETWTSGHWTLANLGSDVSDLKSAYDDTNNSLNHTSRISDNILKTNQFNDAIYETPYTHTNLTSKKKAYSCIHVGGTLAQGVSEMIGKNNINFQSGKTYTIYFDGAPSDVLYLRILNSGGVVAYPICQRIPFVFTPTSNYTDCYPNLMQLCYPNGLSIDNDFYIYIVEGNVSKEEFDDHNLFITKSNPMFSGYGYYPGVIPTSEYTLLDNFYITSSGGNKVSYSSGGYSLFVPCLPNSKYHIIRPADKRFGAGYTEKLPAGSVDVEESTFITTDSTPDGTKYDILTVNTGADAKYLVVYYGREGTSVASKQTILEKMKICGPVFQKKPEYITPQMFGLYPNDTDKRDMTNMFDKMVEYLTSSTEISRVYFPTGTYYGCFSLVNSKQFVEVFGAGDSSILCATKTRYRAIEIYNTTKATVHDMRLISGNMPLNGEELTSFLGHNWRGIYVEQSIHTYLYNLTIYSIGNGIDISAGSRRSTVRNVLISQMVTNGAFVDIDNSDPSDPDNPGKNAKYSLDEDKYAESYTALLPYINNSIAIRVYNSYQVIIADALLNNVGKGIQLGSGTPGAKLSNVEVNKAAGFGLRSIHGALQASNLRIELTGLYDNEYAIILGDVGGTTDLCKVSTLNNVMIQHSASGGIYVHDNVAETSITNAVLLSDSDWYYAFNTFKINDGADYSTWNPEGWEPKWELVIGKNVSRLFVEAQIVTNIQREKTESGEWGGYSNGLKFADDNGQYKQSKNDINVLFSYDYQDPDGENTSIIPASIKNAIVPYNTIPDGNRIFWNCVQM